MSALSKLNEIINKKNPYEGMDAQERKIAMATEYLKMANDSLTKEDFTRAFKSVVDLIKALQATNSDAVATMQGDIKTLATQLRDQADMTLEGMKDSLNSTVKEQLAVISTRLSLIKDGKDGRDGIDGVDGIDGKDGEKGEKGDKGDKGEKGDPGPSGSTTRIGWGAHPLTVQGLGVTVDKNTRVINFVGSGLSSVARTANGVVTVTVQAGAGTFYTETPTGLINGINTTYTVAHDITTVFNFAINGQYLHPTTDYTFSGSTITMVSPLSASLSGLPFTITYA